MSSSSLKRRTRRAVSRLQMCAICCTSDRSDATDGAPCPARASTLPHATTTTTTSTNTSTTTGRTPSVYIPCSLDTDSPTLSNGQKVVMDRSSEPPTQLVSGKVAICPRTEVVLMHCLPPDAPSPCASTPTASSPHSIGVTSLSRQGSAAAAAAAAAMHHKKPLQLRQQRAVVSDEAPCETHTLCTTLDDADAGKQVLNLSSNALESHLNGHAIPLQDSTSEVNGQGMHATLAQSAELEQVLCVQLAAADIGKSAHAEQPVVSTSADITQPCQSQVRTTEAINDLAPVSHGPRHKPLQKNAVSLVSYATTDRSESPDSPLRTNDGAADSGRQSTSSVPEDERERRELKVTILGPFGILESDTACLRTDSLKTERKHSDSRLRRRTTRECRSVSICDADGYVQLNQYKLKHAIGKGSYSIVKLAYNEEDNTHYAMKILSKSKLMKKSGLFKRPPPRAAARSAQSQQGQGRDASGAERRPNFFDPLQRVYHEISILKRLDHKNVVKLAEVLDDPGQDNLYMVFELVQRGAVLDVPTDSPLSEEQSWTYFRDMLLGLEYLHYNNVIHRDIKPSNLLLTDDGHIKIADFGVSDEFRAGDDAQVSSTTGTPAFLAPECLNGQGSYNGKCVDIWSLGVTLHCFIYGNVPFEDESRAALYHKIMTSPLELPPKPVVSDSLRHLLGKMIEKDPAKRISLSETKTHPWVTRDDLEPLLSTDENCRALIEVTEDDVKNSIRRIPRIETLILIRSILRQKSFHNPYKNGARSLTPTRSVGLGAVAMHNAAAIHAKPDLHLV